MHMKAPDTGFRRLRPVCSSLVHDVRKNRHQVDDAIVAVEAQFLKSFNKPDMWSIPSSLNPAHSAPSHSVAFCAFAFSPLSSPAHSAHSHSVPQSRLVRLHTRFVRCALLEHKPPELASIQYLPELLAHELSNWIHELRHELRP